MGHFPEKARIAFDCAWQGLIPCCFAALGVLDSAVKSFDGCTTLPIVKKKGSLC